MYTNYKIYRLVYLKLFIITFDVAKYCKSLWHESLANFLKYEEKVLHLHFEILKGSERYHTIKNNHVDATYTQEMRRLICISKYLLIYVDLKDM